MVTELLTVGATLESGVVDLCRQQGPSWSDGHSPIRYAVLSECSGSGDPQKSAMSTSLIEK